MYFWIDGHQMSVIEVDGVRFLTMAPQFPVLIGITDRRPAVPRPGAQYRGCPAIFRPRHCQE